MSFALEKTRRSRYVKEKKVSTSSLNVKEDDNENWMEKIFACEEKIYEFQDNARKKIAKIGKMSTDII